MSPRKAYRFWVFADDLLSDGFSAACRARDDPAAASPWLGSGPAQPTWYGQRETIWASQTTERPNDGKALG
jgi:hypothetical protein